VDVFIACINHSDDQFYYPSQVAEYYGQHHDGKFLEREQSFQQAADNVRALIDARLDPMAVWATSAHRHGMKFWASLRMNDVHKDHTDIWPSLRSKWEKEHNVRIGDDLPDHYKDARLTYTWAMDYGLQEVRDHKFAIIEEVCERYDVDGFELDFQRAPYFFRNGQRDRVTPLITQFVRRVRTRMDEIGAAKGRPMALAVKVPQTLQRSTLVGLDVSTWIKADLVDVVTPIHSGYLDMNAHIADYVKLARGTDCKIYAGLELNVTGLRTTKKATGAMLRAAASGYYADGADGIYLFNYDAHSPRLPFLPEHKQPLREMGDPRLLAGQDKHYFVTRDMRRQTTAETWPPLHKLSGEMQLPSTLDAGQALTLRFTIGDDLVTARATGVLESLRLIVAIKDLQPSRSVDVLVNVQPAGDSRIDGPTIIYTDPPVQQGVNQLTITQQNAEGESLRVEGVDLLIDYK
jgi:hypothetical protein